jgi:membrane protein
MRSEAPAAGAVAPAGVSFLRWLWLVVKGTFDGYGAHSISLLSAAISYYALFSLIPLLAFVISIAGMILTDDSRRAEFVDWLIDQSPVPLTPENEADLENAIKVAASNSAAGLVISTVLLAWGGSGVFGAMRRSLDAVLDLSGVSMVRGKLRDLMLLGLLGLLMIGSIVLSTLVQAGQSWSGGDLSGPLLDSDAGSLLASHAISLAVSVLLFLAVYRLMPRRPLGWKEAIAAAMIAGTAFEALKILFTLYLLRWGGTNIYASVASVFAFLLWAYASATILLLGAELVVQHRKLATEGVRLHLRVGHLFDWLPWRSRTA